MRTYSHSIVTGDFPLMSYTTREIPLTSLITTQEVIRQMPPVGSHKVDGFDRAQGNNPVVFTTVAHHADGADRQEDNEELLRERLGDAVVEKWMY